MSSTPSKAKNQHPCICHPSCWCLLTTICVTALASAMLMGSMFTNFWELVGYNATRIEEIARLHNTSHRLTWLFNGTVARIALYPSTSTLRTFANVRTTPGNDQVIVNDALTSTKLTENNNAIQKIRRRRLVNKFRNKRFAFFVTERSSEVGRDMIRTKRKLSDSSQGDNSLVDDANRWPREILGPARQPYPMPSSSPNSKWILVHDKAAITTAGAKYRPASKRNNSLSYLIPLHGGIWNLCLDLKDDQMRILRDMGVNRNVCTAYLTQSHYHDDANPRHDHHVQSKMHNLSISCAMVCLILLGAAALLGLFGILQRQISAVLITGVCYILAALFAVFSLTIMHFKRNSRRDCVILDDHIIPEYHETRIFSYGWSMQLGWAGSCLMFIASLLWIFLAKVMRYNPLTFF